MTITATPKTRNELIFSGVRVLALVIMFMVLLANVLPLTFGYKIGMVTSGSMSPTMEPGDIVLLQPYEAGDEVLIGDIINYTAPEGPLAGNQIGHRVIGFYSDGSFITKGDANDAIDKWAISPNMVTSVTKGIYSGPQALPWKLLTIADYEGKSFGMWALQFLAFGICTMAVVSSLYRHKEDRKEDV